MRLHPFISASEQPRPYSEMRAERRGCDPIERVMNDVLQLEAEAQACADPAERKRLQCEAEGLRCAIDEQPRRS